MPCFVLIKEAISIDLMKYLRVIVFINHMRCSSKEALTTIFVDLIKYLIVIVFEIYAIFESESEVNLFSLLIDLMKYLI